MELHEIASAANKQHKPNRNLALAAVKAITAGTGDSDYESRRMLGDLATLYRFFQPATPAKPKTPEQWVAKALPKSDARTQLLNRYSDGERLSATDGHRLHVLHGANLAEGFYDASMQKIELDATFPDIDRVMPGKNPEAYRGQCRKSDLKDLKVGTVSNGKEIVVRFMNRWFNNKYFEEAICMFNDDDLIEIACVGEHDGATPIELRQDQITAVVMGIRGKFVEADDES